MFGNVANIIIARAITQIFADFSSNLPTLILYCRCTETDLSFMRHCLRNSPTSLWLPPCSPLFPICHRPPDRNFTFTMKRRGKMGKRGVKGGQILKWKYTAPLAELKKGADRANSTATFGALGDSSGQKSMQRLLRFRMSCRHNHRMGSTNNNRQLTLRETLTQHLRYVAVARPQRRICGLCNECVSSPHS